METSSKNSRRGRPSAFSEEELGNSDLSLRQRQNRAYAERARPRMRSFWDEGWHKERYVPLCVLSELGRIEDDAKFWDAAWWYAFHAQDLTAKQAAAKIKQIRTGKTPQEGPVILYRQLMRAIEDFQILYPDASLLYVEGQVKRALDTVRGFRQHRS